MNSWTGYLFIWK